MSLVQSTNRAIMRRIATTGKYLKAKLKKADSEVVSGTTQLKLTASDGKKYNTDVISLAGVENLAKSIHNSQAMDSGIPSDDDDNYG